MRGPAKFSQARGPPSELCEDPLDVRVIELGGATVDGARDQPAGLARTGFGARGIAFGESPTRSPAAT
jgi:hypothetical protein